MALGSLIKGYTGLAKDIYKENKPVVDEVKKNITTTPTKKKGETVAPRTPQKPTTVVPPKKEQAEKVEPRAPQVTKAPEPPKTPIVEPIEQEAPKTNVWEKMDWVKEKWPTIQENLKQGTPINSPAILKRKQEQLLEDIKTTKNFDYIREDLSKIQFKTDEERKEFMEPFLRQPGLLEAYIPKPKVNLFNTIRDVKEYINVLKEGEFLTDTSEYLQGPNPTASKALRSVVETILNDPTKKKEIKEYWMKEYENSIKNPYGAEMEENLYSYLVGQTETMAIPPENMTLEEKKEFVELRQPKALIEKNIQEWKQALGFYDREPTEAEIREMQAKQEDATQKEKEDFMVKYMMGDMPIENRMETYVPPTNFFNMKPIIDTGTDYESLVNKYPELAQKAEKEYYKEKEKAYLLSVAEAEMDKLVKENIGIRGVEKLESGEAWNIVRLAKKLVQGGTLDIIKPDTIIGKAYKSTYVEDGFIKYNGLIVDDEFKTQKGKKSAMIADVGAMILGSLLPYSAISNRIKATIQLAAKQEGTLGRLAKASLKAQKSNPILHEVTTINLLEEAADATIRETTGQDYTFSNFLQGVSIGAALGGTMETFATMFKKQGVSLESIAEQLEYRLNEDVLGDMEKILSITKNVDDVKEVQVAPGVSLFDVFQEQKLAFQNRKSQSMFGESRMIGLKGGKEGVPGVDYPADLPKKIEEGTPEYLGVENKDVFFDEDLSVKDPEVESKPFLVSEVEEGTPEYLGVENKDVFFDEDLSVKDPEVESKPFLVSEVDRDGWTYEPEKVDVDFVNKKRREIDDLNKYLDGVNKDIENSKTQQETEKLIEYREGLIQYVKNVKDEIELRKEYSDADIQKIQEQIAAEEAYKVNSVEEAAARWGDNGSEALDFIKDIVDFLRHPGVKSSLSGEKNIGKIEGGRHAGAYQSSKTWQETVSDLFGDSYMEKESFFNILDTLGNKFKSKAVLEKINKLKRRKGEIDDEDLWEEVIVPGINQYVQGIKKVPIREQVETYFKGKKQRGVPRSLTKMKDTTKQTKKILKGENMYYDPLANKKTLDKAIKVIKESEALAFERAVNPQDATDVAIGMILVKKYQADGKYDQLSVLLDRMAVEATKRGQMNQVLAMFSLLTPEGALRHASKIMGGMREATEQGKKISRRYDDIVSKLSKLIENKLKNTEIKFPQQDVKLEVREILRDAKMTERQINKILQAIEKKFSSTEIKFPRENVKFEIGSILKEVSTEFAFLKKFELSEFEMTKIENRVKELHKYPEGSYERMFQSKLLIRDMAELKPPSLFKKIGVYQTAAMLLNIKTLARNIVGNALFLAQENMAKAIASGIDDARVLAMKAVGKEGVKKLDSNFVDTIAALKYAFGNIKKNYREVVNGVDFKFDESYIRRSSLGLTTGRTLESKFGRKIEQALGISLRVPDRFFFDIVYREEMLSAARIEAHNKKIPKAERKGFIEDFINNPPEEAVKVAEARGLYATFQDDSIMSDLLVGLKRQLNFKLEWGVGDILLKFAKTPANLVNRQLAYSPVGFFKLLAPEGLGKAIKEAEPGWSKDLKNVMIRHIDNYNVAEAELAFSRALLGSVITFASSALAAKGILTSPSENQKVNSVEKLVGGGYVQVNRSMLWRYITSGFGDVQPMDGDKMTSYDSLLPIAYQISSGVSLSQEIEASLAAGKTPDMLEVLGALLGKAFDAPNLIAEQPFFTGVSRFFMASNLGGKAMLGAGARGLVESIPSTFIPTLSKQLRQYVDNVPNETYSPSMLQTMVNMTIDRIPFLHDTKIPYIYDPNNKRTITGENAQTYQDATNGIFNVFMNTVFTSELKMDKDSIFNEYLALQKSTGETKFIPVKPEKNLNINDIKYKLNADDYEQYAATQGKITARMHKEIISSPFYNAMSDGEKVKSLYDAFDDARDIAKGEFIYNAINRGDMKLENLTDTYRDKYLLYETLFKAGYDNADKKIYGNIVVQTAILKYKNPIVFGFAKENPGMGKEDLGIYMQEAGLKVNKDGSASKDDWTEYKRISLLPKIEDMASVNNIIKTIEARKSSGEKIITNMEKLASEGKVTEAEKEYVYMATLNEKDLRDLGYLY